MKLVRVGHFRCDSVDQYTYLVAPDGKTDEEISDDVDSVVTEHTSKLREAEAERPPWGKDRITDFPDTLTIAECKKLKAEQDAAYKAWEERKRKRAATFGELMRSRGYLPLGAIDEPNCIYVEAYWGHNHGLGIDYSATETDYTPELPEDDIP